MLLKPTDFSLAAKTLPAPADRDARAGGRTVRETSHSGEVVTVDEALTADGVIAIISLIAQDSAGLPLVLYGRRGRSRFRASDNPYYTLMHDAPNPEHTAVQFREFIVGHMIAWGNFYGQMIYDRSGVVRQIWPLRPDRMTVVRKNGERVYEYRQQDGKLRTFFQDEILHIPGFGFDGLVGYGRISLARQQIGLSLSTQKFGSKFFANDTALGVVFSSPNPLSDTAYARLHQELTEEHVGSDKAHGYIILEEGLEPKRLGFPPEDIQFLETQKLTLAAVNRLLGPLPPHMIGDVTGSTSWGAGIDSQEQGYVNHTLRSYAVRIEQALWLQLLLTTDRAEGLYFEHLFEGLLRGDLQTRSEAYVKAITNGWMSRNEVRARENLNPYPGGDEFLVPLNMQRSQTQSPANAFETLFEETARRVITRESNDVRGAARRLLSKNNPDAFADWVTQFYTTDQPEFAARQFAPVFDALLGVTGLDAWPDFRELLDAQLDARQQSLGGLSLDQVDAACADWRQNQPSELTTRIRSLVQEKCMYGSE
jgi:HK97 family phage portal protein